MKFLLLFCVLFTFCCAFSVFNNIEEALSTFKLKYGNKYNSKFEEIHRLNIFLDNILEIEKHNQRYAQGLESYKQGINQFSDMTPDEFAKILIPSNISRGIEELEGGSFIPAANVKIPERMDWRQYGAVTPIKNQGQCGSCWAFSSTGALEGQHFRATGKLVSLSEQNLMDCSTSYGNHGCAGGWPESAFVYIKDNKGIDTEQSYPYEAMDGPCRYNAAYSGATDFGFSRIKSDSEKDLMEAVAYVGPISIAVFVTNNFQRYASGIFYDINCPTHSPNHAMLVIGYGTDATNGDYWLVKNSWGADWGEQGYIKIARNKGNICGIASFGAYPLV